MKTTIDISDALLDEARRIAADEGTTLRRLVEEGLRLALERRTDRSAFALRAAGYRGEGLQPGIDPHQWEQLRALIYQGRGE
jgi:Arc/MetJ family transcription regulator